MKTKHIINIKGLELYRFAEDKNLYKLPFKSNGKQYSFRLIKQQYPSRWILNGKPYSEKQLRGKLLKDPDPIVLFIDIEDCPF